MNAKRSTPAAISVVGMIAVLGIAWALDVLMTYLGKRNAQTFTLPYVIIWAQSLIFVVIAALMLLLFWYVLRAPHNGWIATLYLIAGAYFAFLPVLYLMPAFGLWMPRLVASAALAPRGYTMISGAFVAVTGLLSLLLPRK